MPRRDFASQGASGALWIIVDACIGSHVDTARWARCSDGRGSFTHLFFSEDPLELARAKAICARCVLREHCLAGALRRGEEYGVWGGEMLVDGKVVAEKRRRGRPPKHPRPPVVVDEVPAVPAVSDKPFVPDVA